MTTFDDRENAFEAKFAHDAELQFRAEARRSRLLAAWAAPLLGLTGDEAVMAYAGDLIMADLKEKGDEDLFRKLASDLKAKGAAVSEADIRVRMVQALEEARRSVVKDL